jgi:opacity protein-like surface antigen
MKKIAIALAALAALAFGGPAVAADVPVKGPYYKAAPAVFDWTGLYIGAHLGYGRENGSDESGLIYGGQIGYNWQFNRNWVFGIEGDFSGTDIRENTIPARVDYLASIRGRLGYAMGRTLIYGTGGWGTAQVTGAGVAVTGDAWVLGAGLEYAIDRNWSVRGEFLHYEFDDNGLPGNAYAQVFRFGVNYRFGMYR